MINSKKSRLILVTGMLLGTFLLSPFFGKANPETVLSVTTAPPPTILYLPLVMHNFPLEQWPVQSYYEIPFTDFNTEHHHIRLEFLADKLLARFSVNGTTYVEFPEKMMPLKALELSQDRLLVICKALFSGNLTMFVASLDGSGLREVVLPPRLTYSLFKQAAIYNGLLLIILYDVHNLDNNFYRWKISDNGIPEVNETSYDHLVFNGRYEVDANIFMTEFQDKLYFVGEGVAYIYQHDDITDLLSRYELPGKLAVTEISVSSSGIAGLFYDEELKKTPYMSMGQNVFKIIDLLTRAEIVLERSYNIPYKLRYENEWTVSEVIEPDDLVMLLEYDLRHRSPSGMYDLGGNNIEGRVAWAQVYYLNGFIDLVKKWENEESDFSFLGKQLREEIKLRLDLEMYLLDRLLDSDNPGMLCSRYSVNRTPVIHAVQTGRTLRLFKRYLVEVDNPLPLNNYERFLDTTRNLEDHIEVLVRAGGDDPETITGEYFLKWPKGSAFWADGVAIPYNHQDDWAGGVAYSAQQTGDDTYLLAAKDIVTILLTNEQFYTSPPSDYQWHYWWGRGRLGWKPTDGISVNTPEYLGQNGMADISYSSIDVMAVLSVGRIYPEVLPNGFLTYVKDAIEQNGVYPFVTEELLKYNVYPNIPLELATLYVRVKSPWELQNSAWALLSLFHQLRP